jgi:hypothetical protein
VIGFDFLLRAGVPAGLYQLPHPFLLSPEDAFRLIPLGYLSFLVFCIALAWVMMRAGVRGALPGVRFGLVFGVLVWASWSLALASISTAPRELLIGWFLGQGVETGIAGLTIGAAYAGGRLKPMILKLTAWLLLCAVLGVALQNL